MGASLLVLAKSIYYRYVGNINAFEQRNYIFIASSKGGIGLFTINVRYLFDCNKKITINK